MPKTTIQIPTVYTVQTDEPVPAEDLRRRLAGTSFEVPVPLADDDHRIRASVTEDATDPSFSAHQVAEDIRTLFRESEIDNYVDTGEALNLLDRARLSLESLAGRRDTA